MTVHSTSIDHASEKMLGDVAAWAERVGEPYATICELRKVPARLGMIDDDIGLIPADRGYFEAHIAPSGYGMVSKAGDLKAARQRGNSRLRALLDRYHDALTTGGKGEGRGEWNKLIDFVQECEGFTGNGAAFATGTSRGLMMLRARFDVPPRAVAAADITRIATNLNAQKRKALRRALQTVNRLVMDFGHAPQLDGLLPEAPLSLPGPISTRERIHWADLPEAFRSDVEDVMRGALARPEDRMAEARDRIEAGANAAEVLRDLDEMAAGRRKGPDTPDAAISSWRSAITWLVLAAERHGVRRDHLERLAPLYTSEILETACRDQIARSDASVHLKDPRKTQTLKSRLTALETLAKHGLKRPDLVAIVELQKRFHDAYVRGPGKAMTDDVRRLCDALTRRPTLVAGFVNAPREIAARAAQNIDAARSDGNIQGELSGLRLYETAVLFAVQVSRPIRSSNLIGLRYRGTRDVPGHVTWIKARAHSELRFNAGEIKNDREVTVHLFGDEARILWTWLHDLRPRYLALRGLADTPYVLPGTATPRLVRTGQALPTGCIAPSTLSEIWRDGADIIGLDMTPHQSRHVIATLILAVEPGNYAKAASVLGDTEETVRRHYGRDSGAEAARQARAALKSRHPGLFRMMRERIS